MSDATGSVGTTAAPAEEQRLLLALERARTRGDAEDSGLRDRVLVVAATSVFPRAEDEALGRDFTRRGQRSTRRIESALGGLAVLAAATAFVGNVLSDSFGWQVALSAIETALLVAALLVLLFHPRDRQRQLWVHARFLAEQLRLAVFLHAVGVPVADLSQGVISACSEVADPAWSRGGYGRLGATGPRASS